MFKRIFGQGSGGGGGPAGPRPNVSSTAQTVDAIQKLGEVSSLLPCVNRPAKLSSPQLAICWHPFNASDVVMWGKGCF